jgi:hypothetical protein
MGTLKAPMRESFRAYMQCKDEKYHIIGEGAGEGTLSFGTVTEVKPSITNKTSKNIAKKGAWTLPIATSIDLNDPVIVELLQETIKLNVSKEFDILIVWEFMHKEGDTNSEILTAHTFKAILPLTDLGGAGQAEMLTNFTISNANDVVSGFVDASDEGTKYDATTDTYSKDAFSADEMSNSVPVGSTLKSHNAR